MISNLPHNHRNIGLSVGFIALSLCLALPVIAADAPTSKCVTATTKSQHATFVARMEKDVAPYAGNEKAQTTIKNYRDKLATAWAAMEDQYCGYGSYGAASSIKSYTKSIDRARAEFLTDTKNIAKVAATAQAAVVKKDESSDVEQKPAVKTNAVAAIATSAPGARAKIVKGLIRGMRSAYVTELQKLLAEHFDLPQDDSHVTGFFGPLTQSLVLKFQLEKKIVQSGKTPGAGQVGPKTAEALNNL
ncbi:MAG: hypothetical protein PHS79_03280 [Patescibacteria group bacterium]|nr:hypothetical protein [Patescibacteria group bacterium]